MTVWGEHLQDLSGRQPLPVPVQDTVTSLALLASLETLLEKVMPAQGFCVSCCRHPHWGLRASRDSHPRHQEWCNQHTGRRKASHSLFPHGPLFPQHRGLYTSRFHT